MNINRFIRKVTTHLTTLLGKPIGPVKRLAQKKQKWMVTPGWIAVIFGLICGEGGRDRMSMLEQLNKEKIMAMIRGVHPNAAERTVEALVQGGIRFIEVTTNTEGVYSLVERWRKTYGRDLTIGVGTVLGMEMAKQAINSGAQFIVSPNLDEEVIAYGASNHIDVYPGGSRNRVH
ncbi:bifunctional 4-hydroxy-2-oxoglutarate aldolase/2-dehydro-3-deoxy-phosphogluconate aldolase [Paenibacillus oralis]|uniref:bifunctional 4-hydroxy-2-oxoglutarate aldolase/2-dehydro-3-deoxy-phosphogluconate aldolase n=1 Tax=Paenibacillus oralis TaxID=2490856 RepID=UPI001FE35E1D|nr:bifunctional 4-hydroxy-2-oxoglutarate aldolase/2-dehydro-3-deoxy-phosphogluconate aldolase [Paenibacillus oralis]